MLADEPPFLRLGQPGPVEEEENADQRSQQKLQHQNPSLAEENSFIQLPETLITLAHLLSQRGFQAPVEFPAEKRRGIFNQQLSPQSGEAFLYPLQILIVAGNQIGHFFLQGSERSDHLTALFQHLADFFCRYP